MLVLLRCLVVVGMMAIQQKKDKEGGMMRSSMNRVRAMSLLGRWTWMTLKEEGLIRKRGSARRRNGDWQRRSPKAREQKLKIMRKAAKKGVMDREKFIVLLLLLCDDFQVGIFGSITGALMGNTIGMARSFISFNKKGSNPNIINFFHKKIKHTCSIIHCLNTIGNTTHQTLPILQLSISRLDRLLTVFRLGIGDSSTLPAKRLESLGEDGVGVVVAGIHPVRIHSAQVLDLELEEGLGELLRVPELLGEVI